MRVVAGAQAHRDETSFFKELRTQVVGDEGGTVTDRVRSGCGQRRGCLDRVLPCLTVSACSASGRLALPVRSCGHKQLVRRTRLA